MGFFLIFICFVILVAFYFHYNQQYLNEDELAFLNGFRNFIKFLIFGDNSVSKTIENVTSQKLDYKVNSFDDQLSVDQSCSTQAGQEFSQQSYFQKTSPVCSKSKVSQVKLKKLQSVNTLSLPEISDKTTSTTQSSHSANSNIEVDCISTGSITLTRSNESINSVKTTMLLAEFKPIMTPIPFVFFTCPQVRRSKLPSTQIELKSIPLSSVIKGQLPIWAYEPIGTLQLLCEELRFANTLLNKAINALNATQRMAFVAAFIISGYTSFAARKQKPFNPICGETFDYISEDGWQYHAEQLSHRPPISASFAQHKDWEWHNCAQGEAKVTITGSAELTFKLPVLLRLHKYNEIYMWNKVKTVVLNPLKEASKRVLRLEGLMTIRCSNGIECRLVFKNCESNTVTGTVYENKKVVFNLSGSWDKGLSRILENKKQESLFEAPKISRHISDFFYGFTPFTITLNELHSSDILPPTDSRLRPDQRLLEEGDVKRAFKVKEILEKTQRQRENSQPKYLPLWFKSTSPAIIKQLYDKKDSPNFSELWRTNGRYWKSRAKKFQDKHSAHIIKDLFKI